MPLLTLKSEKGIIERISLHKDKILTIGELPDNGLVIDDPAVSGHHAEIEVESGLFYITDQQSRNGTFINDELIISRALTQGDVITVGAHVLEFSYEEGEAIPPDPEIFNPRMTMALDTREHRSKLARSVSHLADDDHQKQTVAILSYMDGSNRRFPLNTFPVKIGKSPENHIRIKGLFMGKTTAVINHIDEEFRLAPAEGLTKPKVNYQAVKNEVVLNEFDVIEIGSTKLQFHFESVGSPDGDWT
ncbi:MAG: FHA domain-containing protein [Deltaproteobacteria bacterium]|nr:FHA domain-containing protein [Deltaproteobacteria bacterium]